MASNDEGKGCLIVLLIVFALWIGGALVGSDEEPSASTYDPPTTTTGTAAELVDFGLENGTIDCREFNADLVRLGYAEAQAKFVAGYGYDPSIPSGASVFAEIVSRC